MTSETSLIPKAYFKLLLEGLQCLKEEGSGGGGRKGGRRVEKERQESMGGTRHNGYQGQLCHIHQAFYFLFLLDLVNYEAFHMTSVREIQVVINPCYLVR